MKLLETIYEKPVLCPIDLEALKNDYNVSVFGPMPDKDDYNPTLSKSLCLNGEVIGGYLLKKFSMLEGIKGANYWMKEGELKDIKFFVTKEYLKKYSSKLGICGRYVYIKEEYRNKGYGKILIDYSLSLGDYVWGGAVLGKTDDYWANKIGRIKIYSYTDVISNVNAVITATPL